MITNPVEDTPAPRRPWLFGTAGLLALGCLVVWWPGCRQYPAVTTPDSLRLMKLLYAACNTQDPRRLGQVEVGVASLTRAGRLAPPETAAFGKIIGLARAGDWKAAEQASFRFAQDQVGVGHPAPTDHDHKHRPKAQTKR